MYPIGCVIIIILNNIVKRADMYALWSKLQLYSEISAVCKSMGKLEMYNNTWLDMYKYLVYIHNIVKLCTL